MASAIRFPARPLSSRAVFRDSASDNFADDMDDRDQNRPEARPIPTLRAIDDRPGIHALPTHARAKSDANVIHFPWDMPREIRRKAAETITPIADRYAERSAAHLQRALQDLSSPAHQEAHIPTYKYANLMTVGPFQFHGEGPCRPSNVLNAGEWTAIVAVEWNNPAPGPAGSLPGNVVVGGRAWRLRFESLNRTQMLPGESKCFGGVFPTVAPEINVHSWFFVAPDPGELPAWHEVNVIFSVALGPQPLVTFPLRQIDPDGVAPFLEAEPDHQAGEPIRYVVMPKPAHIANVSISSLTSRLGVLARQIVQSAAGAD